MRASLCSLQAAPRVFRETSGNDALAGGFARRHGRAISLRPPRKRAAGRLDAGAGPTKELASAASEGAGSCTLPQHRTAERIADSASRSRAQRSQWCTSAERRCSRIAAVSRRTIGEGGHSDGAAPARARPRGAAGDAARANAAARPAREPQGFLGPRGAAAARALLLRLRRRPAVLRPRASELALRSATVHAVSRTTPAGRSPGRRAGPRRARD